MTEMDIGSRLKMQREKLQMTQDLVAEKLGVTRQTISNWENGRSYPDIERMVRLSDIYELSLDELLKGDYKMINFLQKNTTVNRNLKWFSLLLISNIFLIAAILIFQKISPILFIGLFFLLTVNTLSIYYLVIKKI